MTVRNTNVAINIKGYSDLPSVDCFRTVQTAVVVVDAHHQVLFVNSAAMKLLGPDDNFSYSGMKCHQLICRDEMSCKNCVLDSPTDGPKPHAIRNNSGEERYIKEEHLCFPEFNILILFDVTREIAALKKLDMARKELKAKTVLLERRRDVAASEKRRIQAMFDQLPEAFVHVTDEYGVLNKNKAVTKILPLDSAQTCHELLGKEAPCPECPAREGFHLAGERKVTHRLEGRCLTEHIIQGSDTNGGMLLFSDTTRQIELIEQIRKQQDTITRKNEILSNLVAFQTRMQKAVVSIDMINYFLDIFLPVCHAQEAIVIIDDIRPGSVWFVARRGVEASRATRVVRGYLSRDVQQMDRRIIPGGHLPWKETCQVELIGGNGWKVGMVLFPQSDADDERESVQLFSEPFGAFIHNRLLLRQLEEKANTDPLTGLYNRRYFDDALAAEKHKNEEFDIPYSVIAVDVNRLKQANDQYGHDTGDRLLLYVGERLKKITRATDIVARTGGDEFIILLADTNEQGAVCLIERLNRIVFHNAFLEVGENETFPVSVSMGAAGIDRVSHDELLKTADKRMYEAKGIYYQTQDKYR